MGWSNKVYIVATGILQKKHHAGYLLAGYFIAAAFMADIVILAEITQEVAVSKKYSAGTIMSNQQGLFSIVRMITGNRCIFTCFANAKLA